jgi:hypothetical protein
VTRVVLVALLSLVFADDSLASACNDRPIREMLDDADAAVVGRVVAQRPGAVEGAPVLILTVDVEQHVKGDVGRTIEVRSPSGSEYDVDVPRDKPVGFLLTRAPGGAWLATACSVVGPGRLVVEGGEPRGGVIKVGVGIVILALVLLWALRRLRKGSRPDLPGAPGP